MSIVPTNDEQLRAEIRARYGKTALQVQGPEQTSAERCCEPDCCTAIPSMDTTAQKSTAETSACCGSSCCSTHTANDSLITSDLYSEAELGAIPLAAALASLGCGNPTVLAELKPGERVLDLGSGGGIDVLLSAKRVGATGFAYGLDMTDEMLALAERNRQAAGSENVQFLKGLIEAIPLPANSVDVVISNCVINLAADKRQVLREAYRVLTPGGRLAISDIVFQGQFPQGLRADLEAWAGCVAGALEEETYRQLLAEVGFTDIEIEVTRRYALDDIRGGSASASLTALSADEYRAVDGKFVSAFVRARKPCI
ncbi:MAG: arsenite methyltransferase [Chloroflexi bacterium]|nr:MAG: arsenite methyltransferase [Chloroflexota bacterium]